MELFKTTFLKKEFKDFTEKLLPAVLECSYCNKLACHWHGKFDISFIHCRKIKCNNCFKFNISKDILLDSADEQTNDYLINFICDFLKLSSESIKQYFPNVTIVRREKINTKLSYIKSQKNRAQVVSVRIPSGEKSNISKWTLQTKSFLLVVNK